MEGDNLKKAAEWFSKALSLAEKKQNNLSDRAMERAIEFEKAGIAKGESWDK